MAFAKLAWLENLKAHLAADKKKAAVLGALSAILLVVVVKQFVFGSGEAPVAAVASAPAAAPAAPASPAARPVQAAGSGPANPAPAKGADANPRPAQPTLSPEQAVSVEGYQRSMDRDPFRTTTWKRFGPSFVGDEGSGEKPKSAQLPGFWSRLEESIREYQSSRQQEAKEINATLTGLTLRSTVTGSSPMAFISGRLVRPGDEIEGFSVVKILDRRVMLRKDGQTRILGMP